MTGVVKLAPSILSADFARLGEQVQEAEQAGADRIHVDVMDGHFVPNLALGAPAVASLRRATRLALEIHMMVSAPDLFLDEFVAAGADSFLVHWEGNNNLHRTVQRIKELRKRAGVVINPATPVAVLEDILQDVAQVLIMTVDPGFAHQPFITTTLPKIRRVRRMIELAKTRCEVEVDGGIDTETAPLAVTAGADVLVAGTAIFNEGETVAKAMDRLRASVQHVHEQRQVA
jgi:ribulose-phosphate 3-epimerase